MRDSVPIRIVGRGVFVGRLDLRRPGLALVVMSVVELRLDAVRAVLAGARATEVAAQAGVSRQSVRTWVGRYLREGVGGLADRSHRPGPCPRRAPDDDPASAEHQGRPAPGRQRRMNRARRAAGPGPGPVELPENSALL